MENDPLDILTPQGYLSRIQANPGLDVVMNLFRIPRAFAVSGFGDWNVGQHSFCAAFLALYWARHRGYPLETRDRLMVLGLTHDLHESATGDILPGLKVPALRERLDDVQRRFLNGLGVAQAAGLEGDLKLLDRVAFLYEIRQAAWRDNEQRRRLADFFQLQKTQLLEFAAGQGFDTVEAFLREIGLEKLEDK
ncbi:MAG: HD domain-containing protein [Deltaproteobacteria bacterium]|nr:HD domain-containing protein [Deltaproteobacteria bacterium]